MRRITLPNEIKEDIGSSSQGVVDRKADEMKTSGRSVIVNV